jgi:hypothetical protein
MVPADYAFGGTFRIHARKNTHVGAAELLTCAVSVNSGPLQPVGTVEVVATSPTSHVCTPSLPFLLSPGDTLGFYFSITSPGVMDDAVTILSVGFEYSSSR